MKTQDFASRVLARDRDSGVVERDACIEIRDDLAVPFYHDSFACIVDRFLRDIPEIQAGREEFFAHFGEAFERLSHFRVIEHMRGLRQFGVKQNVLASAFVLGRQEISQRFLLERDTHTKCVAVVALLLGMRMKLPTHELAVLALGARLHDVGHCAYSHDGDELLVSLGYPAHEKRTEAIIRFDPELNALFGEYDVRVEDILEVVRENGVLGKLLKIADTLAYVIHDADQIGWDMPLDLAGDIIRSLEGFENEHMIVRETASLERLLALRAKLGQRFYFSFASKVSAEAFRALARQCLKREILTPTHFINGTDSFIDSLLSLRFEHAPPSTGIRSLHLLAHGFFDELFHHWRVWEGESAQEAQSEFFGSDRALVFRIDPHDYTNKTYRVLCGGQQRILRARDIRSAEEKRYLVCSFIGSSKHE